MEMTLLWGLCVRAHRHAIWVCMLRAVHALCTLKYRCCRAPAGHCRHPAHRLLGGHAVLGPHPLHGRSRWRLLGWLACFPGSLPALLLQLHGFLAAACACCSQAGSFYHNKASCTQAHLHP